MWGSPGVAMIRGMGVAGNRDWGFPYKESLCWRIGGMIILKLGSH